MVEPVPGDAFGDLLRRCWSEGGAPGRAIEVVERDDGFIGTGDAARYVGGADSWSPQEAAVLPHARGRVLDIGCGAGRHLIGLRERGLDVRGVDPSPGAVAVCRERGLDALVADLDHLPAGPFDTLLLFGSNLSLLGSPAAAPARLAALAAAAAPGARILGSAADPLPHRRRRPGGSARWSGAPAPTPPTRWFSPSADPSTGGTVQIPDDWRISIRAGRTTPFFALWLRDLAAIEVPPSPLVPGPLDVDLPPPFGDGHEPGLGAEWLAWWVSLFDGRRQPPGHAVEPADDTPDPLGLARLPVLRGHVARRWPQFLDWRLAHPGGHGAFGDGRPDTGPDNGAVVREVEAALGRKARPFSLTFTLLPLRDTTVRAVDATHHLVPERIYLGARWPARLRDLVSAVA